MSSMKKIFFSFLFYLLAEGCPVWGQVFNVLDYGAVKDTLHLSTSAIQKAIDDCTSKGGGTVLIPAGDYLSTGLYLKDNVNLYLEAGATLYASRNVNDYEQHWAIGAADHEQIEVLVGAINAKNISVTGTGTLNCRAERIGFRRSPQLAVTDSITGREIDNAIRYGADYQSKFKKVPPFTGAINFNGCTNVHIRDVQVVEANSWSVHIQWCDRVFVNGIHIKSSSADGVNSDGLDIDGCSNVTISDCIIDTGDDALCLKTTLKDGKALPCQWITVTNCILTSSSAALKLGTESHANFENITISNCLIKDANRGLNIIIRDGATVRNVVISDLVIHTVRKATFWWGNGDPLWFTIQKRENSCFAGSIENVSINNIIAYGQSGVRMEGFHNVMKNIRINNFQLFMEPEPVIDKRARNGFLFYGVEGLSLIDCQVKWNTEHAQKEWESAYLFENIKGLEMVRVKGEKAPLGEKDAFRYKNVRDITIDGKVGKDM